jgi:hypothetical protein
VTKRLSPNGGVMSPASVKITASTPNHTRSICMDFRIGRITGIVVRMIENESMSMPGTR